MEQDLKDFEKSMQLDYFGSLYLAKAVLPGMLKRDSGQILFIASPLALAGKPAALEAFLLPWLLVSEI